MEIQRKKSIGGPIAIFLAILLIALVVVAGFLWLREADARLQAEQETAEIQEKYDKLRSQCDAMKSGGVSQGIALDGASENPIVNGLEAQTEVPACERPTTQPFTEPMREQDPQFFAEAQEGDVLVTYTLSKKVYLYRESTGTLVNQATIADAPDQQPQQPQTQSQTQQGMQLSPSP